MIPDLVGASQVAADDEPGAVRAPGLHRPFEAEEERVWRHASFSESTTTCLHVSPNASQATRRWPAAALRATGGTDRPGRIPACPAPP